MTIVALLLSVLVLEVVLTLVVRRLRKDFQWLITEADEVPTLDRHALRRFLDSSFDPDLGWSRRPNSTGTERGRRGAITFHIDSDGARRMSDCQLPITVAAFGDSYVFCRQVEDHETWEEYLSRDLKIGVKNFGVGNYGVDQALLRYERTSLPDTVKIAILGFVPETICRIQSSWKHYLEFGNTFAFKPRFTLDPSGTLALVRNPVRSSEDFEHLPDLLPAVRATDGMYLRKFRALQFRFPYLASFVRHPFRHATLIVTLLVRSALRTVGVAMPQMEQRPFTLVMERNIRDAHRMYEDPDARALLRGILLRFKQIARSRGHHPLVLVMPQLLDLKQALTTRPAYCSYFNNLGGEVDVLDLTATFARHDAKSLYVEDQYGGHLSESGNQIVAATIGEWLRDSDAFRRLEAA